MRKTLERIVAGIAASWALRKKKPAPKPAQKTSIGALALVDLLMPELRRLYGQNLQIMAQATVDADYRFLITDAAGCRITDDNSVQVVVRYYDLMRAETPGKVIYEALEAGIKLLRSKKRM